jgi:rhodanese-related sulfurtransferase
MSVPLVSVAEMRGVLKGDRTPLLIDVRTPAEFAGVHAAGARSMPLDALDPSAVAAARIAPTDPIYVICQSGARSAKACERLAAGGVGPVFSVEGGTAAWERAGLPVERGESKVISLERQVRIVAGALVLIAITLAWLVHPWFQALAAFVGAGLVFAGVTDHCGMGLLLGRMPWNRGGGSPGHDACPVRTTSS